MSVTKAPPPRLRRTEPFAIAALVCGVIQFCGGVFPAGIAAIFLGHIARRRISQTGDDGLGLAKAGLTLGYAGLVFGVLGLLFLLVTSTSGP